MRVPCSPARDTRCGHEGVEGVIRSWGSTANAPLRGSDCHLYIPIRRKVISSFSPCLIQPRPVTFVCGVYMYPLVCSLTCHFLRKGINSVHDPPFSFLPDQLQDHACHARHHLHDYHSGIIRPSGLASLDLSPAYARPTTIPPHQSHPILRYPSPRHSNQLPFRIRADCLPLPPHPPGQHTSIDVNGVVE